MNLGQTARRAPEVQCHLFLCKLVRGWPGCNHRFSAAAPGIIQQREALNEIFQLENAK